MNKQPRNIRVSCIPRFAAIAMVAGAGFIAQADPPGGYTVDNVVGQFNLLAHNPDPVSIRIGVGTPADQCRHYQGILRYNGPDGTPYMFLSKSGNHTEVAGVCICGCTDFFGELDVARMGSRPKHRERMRSNILNPTLNFSDTPPPTNDLIVSRFVPEWKHVGGMQIVDGVLVAPVERTFADEAAGGILFFDITNPESPQLLYTLLLGHHVGIAGITRDPGTGRYILACAEGNVDDIEWYESTITDLHTVGPGSFSLIYTWHRANEDQAVRDKWETWQTLNFIRQTNGTLFAAFCDNTSSTDTGDDWTRLFRVTRNGSTFDFTYEAERHLMLSNPRVGNAAAATGFYVSPGKNLILYTGEHETGGPGSSIRCGEARSVNVSVTGTDPSSNTWVELYQDNTGWDDNDSPDRSLMFDDVDVSLENWTDLDTENNWGDDADSLKFRAPAGQMILLFKNQNFGGDDLRLMGTGNVESISRLDDYNFGDAIHSVFTGTRPVPQGSGLTSTMFSVFAFANSHQYQGTIGVQARQTTYHEGALSTGVAPGYRSAYRPPTSGRATIMP